MRRTFLLAVILTAMLPLCAQDNKLTGLRRTLTEHYSDDAEKRGATPLWTKFATGIDADNRDFCPPGNGGTEGGVKASSASVTFMHDNYWLEW